MLYEIEICNYLGGVDVKIYMHPSWDSPQDASGRRIKDYKVTFSQGDLDLHAHVYPLRKEEWYEADWVVFGEELPHVKSLPTNFETSKPFIGSIRTFDLADLIRG